MALTEASITQNLQNPINAVFQQTFLRRAQQVCPFLVGTQPGTLTKQAGTSTIKWRRVEQLSASTTALSELTTAAFMGGRSSVTPSVTDITATVSKYGQFFIVSEEVDLYAPNGTTNELVAILGESAGRSLNQLMAGISQSNFTQVYAQSVATLATVVTNIATNDINYVVNKLTNNAARVFAGMSPGSVNIGTVPILDSYWGITHPDVAYDISNLTGFINVAQYAQQVQILTGEFGYYPMAGRGVRFVLSEDALVSLGGGAANTGTTQHTTTSNLDVYNTIIYGMDCLGSVGLGMKHSDGIFRAGDNTGGWEIINHPLGSAGAADPFNEMATLAYKLFFAGAVLNTNWGYDIRSGATLIKS